MRFPCEIKDKRILIGALNWGLGHVSRDIELIFRLKENGNSVFFAGNLNQIHVVKQYFPDVECVLHDGYPFTFKGKGNFAGDIFWSLPHLFHFLRQERKIVDDLVKELEIDVVISDHRYGFCSREAKSIFLSHQLSLPLRKYQKPIQFWHRKLISEFDEIWIPDEEDNRLAGELSSKIGWSNAHYIGWMSRFAIYKKLEVKQENKVGVIASGPDIYAKHFLKDQLVKHSSSDNFIFIADSKVAKAFPHYNINSSLNWPETDETILKLRKIISRSGYSTLMDIKFLNVEAELYPTPGQSEQLYLSRIWESLQDTQKTQN